MMNKKHLVLQAGFVVVGREIISCHFKNITTKDMWGEESSEYLVLIDGVVSIIGYHKNSVFLTEEDAALRLTTKQQRHVKFCQEQIKYYQKRIKEQK